MTARIEVTVPVTNSSKNPVDLTIEKGTLIEVGVAGMQNVVVAETKTTTLQPGESKSISVEAYCMNQNLSYPNRASGKLTKLSTAVPFSTQADVWNTQNNPKLTPDPIWQLISRLKREMTDRFSLGDVRSLAAQVGINPDEIGGDTLSERVFNLLDHCRRLGILLQLVDELRRERPRATAFEAIQQELSGSTKSAEQ